MSSDHQHRNGVPEVGDGEVPGIGHNGPPSEIDSPAYWHSLIPETEAAEFLDLTPRTMQAMRQRGGGPRFVRISARCIKYRRVDLKSYADKRLRYSTSDPGEAA